DETGHFDHAFVQIRLERDAAIDDAVVLKHGKEFDFALDDSSAARHQGTVGLKRFDQPHDGADVVHRGGAQIVERVFDHHGADPVVGEDFKQYAAVQRVGQQVGAGDSALDGSRRVAQKGGRVFVERAAGQQGVGVFAGQLGVDRPVFVADDAILRQEDEFFGAQRHCNAGGKVFHGQVEGFAGGRKAQWRQQYDGALVHDRFQRVDVELAHGAGVLVVETVDNAHWTRRDEVARDDAYLGVRHGSVGQALAEAGLDVETDFAGRFFGALECLGRSRLGAAAELRRVAFQFKLLVDLRARPVHQHQLDAQRRQQRKVLYQCVEGAVVDQFAAESDHE